MISSPPQSSSNRIVWIIAAIAFLGFPFLTWGVTMITDYWWFADMGQGVVFTTGLLSGLLTGTAFAVATFLIVYLNARLAKKLARPVLTSFTDQFSPQLEETINAFRSRIGPVVKKVILIGSLVLSALVGISMAPTWDMVRLAMVAQPFDLTDPQFALDVSFFVFTLPLLRLVADWLTSILILAVIATAFVYLVGGAIQPWARSRGFAPQVKAHLSVLAGLAIVSKAFDYYLRIFELNFSDRGQVFGASFTDIHAQIPAYQILIVISLVAAVALLINIRIQGWRLPVLALSVWLVAAVLVGGVYPEIIQRFRVNPNELSAEEPYIERNIEATRKAFGLDDIETREFPADQALTAEDIAANQDTLDNIRLWDPDTAAQAYRQLQIIRQYYTFNDVDVDRYTLDDKQRQVLIAARELDVNLLDPRAQTWINRHLVYTHGFGVVMSPVNEVDGRGFPQFFISDIPLRSSIEVTVTRPGIYFGELTDDYVIVDTSLPEFDFPMGETNAETFWEGTGGVDIGNLFNRALFAMRFGDSQILFSRYIEPDSRVLFHRDIVTRVQKLAPWLILDSDPYPVIHEGRVLWVLDGFTHSDHFPYSQPHGGVNYIRNSVKVTVDAYDGTTTLYAFDTQDPILAAWSEIMPGLLTDMSELPEGLAEHFRYPADLFTLQAEVFRRYHTTNTRVFYNKEDIWEFPGEGTPEGPMQPYYVLSRLPGDESEDFKMIMPFTPRGRDNMIGWMATSSDPDNYGATVVYRFPKDRVVLGPDQIRARINQDEDISPQLSLWGQRGSQVIFGSMLVIPLEESVIYIQPLYLQAEQASIPELTRVLVVYGDSVEMAPDLEAALLAAFGEAAQVPVVDGGEGAPPTDPAADARTARDLFEQAIASQREGDWAEYGRLIDQLGDVLSRLVEPGSTEPTVTP